MKQKNELPLSEPGAYKDLLRRLLFEDELVRQLVMPSGGTPDSQTEEVWLTRHCLDVPYLDEQITDERSLLLIECLPLTSGEIRSYSITVTVCCHRNLINLSAEKRAGYHTQYGLTGNLADMIVMAVNQALSKDSTSRSFGIGKLRPASEKPVVSFIPTNQFYGKTLTFEVFEMRRR